MAHIESQFIAVVLPCFLYCCLEISFDFFMSNLSFVDLLIMSSISQDLVALGTYPGQIHDACWSHLVHIVCVLVV